jgi:uncharacterized protein
MSQRRWMGGAAGAVLALAAGWACAHHPAPAAAPSTAATARGPLPGKFVWHDLVTEDPAGCRRFYGSLLGWRFEDTQRGGKPYVLARAGAGYVAGMVALPPDKDQALSQWVPYLSVPDVDQAAARTAQAGGRTLVAPRPVGSIARAAVVADPQGAALGLVKLTGGDPADEPRPVTGRFFWMEYLAGDPGPALSFYQDLAGYDSRVRETPAGIAYHVLSRERPRAGLLKSPLAGTHAAWLSYVLVDDPAALAARVASLGGTVLLAPRPDVRNGSLAVVTDPSGAAVALQKFPFE